MMSFGLLKLHIYTSLLLCALPALGQELIPVGTINGTMSLGEVVRHSSMIAKLKIVSTRAVMINEQSRQDTCGFIYAAKVLDSLKGNTIGDVSFFVPATVTTVDTGVNYLAFLKYRSERDVRDVRNVLSDGLSNGEDASLRCKFPSGYYMPAYWTLMPFDLDATRQFGGVWLSSKADRGKPQLIFCQVAKSRSDNIDDASHKRKKSGGYVTSWTEVSRLIKKADGMFSFLNRSGLDECAG